MSPRRSAPARSGGKSTSRALIAMAVLGGLVLLYGWNSFFLAPRSRAKAKVAKELAAAKQSELDLRQSLAQLSKLAANSQAREAELARFATLIPSDPDLAGAILLLNDTARQAGVDWSSFAPATSAAGAGPVTLSFSIGIGGSFGQIFDYLRRLETLDRLVVVDSVQLNAGGGAGGSKLVAQVKARMFAAGTGALAAPASGSRTSSVAAEPSSPAALVKAGG